MKLENKNKKAVFLAPKVYGYITIEDKEIIKVKGLSRNLINFNELEELLLEGSQLELKTEKWYRSLSLGKIQILNQIYTLKVTDNKRELIYDNYSKLVATVPKELG